MIHVAISGAAGRMGRALARLVLEAEDLELCGALEAADHPATGADAGTTAGAGACGIVIGHTLPETVDVLVDFSLPEGSVERVEACAEAKVPCVVGTTGFTEAQRERLGAAAKATALVLSPNMSVGVNVLFHEAASLARTLGEDYDIEIVEAHHRHKKDAPSGTAVRLAENICAATGRDYRTDAIHGREGAVGARTKKEIGIHAVRAGDIVGDHTVIFCAEGERIELTHRAHTRDTFARGALRAARFLAGKAPGVYTMEDVLGSEE